MIRPFGPVPGIFSTGSPASLASRRARGLEKTRPPEPLLEAAETPITALAAGCGSGLTGAVTGPGSERPSSASSASRSAGFSAGSPTIAMGAPTLTSAPSGTRVFRMTPPVSASTSATAFSVSTMAITSAAAYGVFSAIGQLCRTASTAFAATSGMRRILDMSVPAHLVELGGRLLGTGDGRTFEDLADAGRRLATGHTLHRLVQPVEE